MTQFTVGLCLTWAGDLRPVSGNAVIIDFTGVGSPGRTRTYNLVVTSYPIFLPDLDYLFTILTQSKIRCRALKGLLVRVLTL